MLWHAEAVSDSRTNWFFSMKLLNRFANRTKRFIHELEWFDCSCSRVNNSLIQMNRLVRVSSELNSQIRTGRSCERARLMLLKVSYYCRILGLIIVTENHIYVKTVICLWTKSAVKGDLFKPTEMLECKHISICAS